MDEGADADAWWGLALHGLYWRFMIELRFPLHGDGSFILNIGLWLVPLWALKICLGSADRGRLSVVAWNMLKNCSCGNRKVFTYQPLFVIAHSLLDWGWGISWQVCPDSVQVWRYASSSLYLALAVHWSGGKCSGIKGGLYVVGWILCFMGLYQVLQIVETLYWA